MLTRHRFYEILPGAIVWTVMIASLILSLFQPLWVIYFIIVYDLFWFLRVCYFSIMLFFSWRIYSRETKVDWMKRLDDDKLDWRGIYHYVILPTSIEPVEVLDATLNSLLQSNYPSHLIIVHLAGEERCKDNFLPLVETLKAKYEKQFFKLIYTVHPDGVEGEMRGKGANAHYAGWEGKKIVDELGLNYENIICSYFDSDTCVHPQYFPNLTYRYLTTPDRVHKAYQPAVVYNNNVWESPAITRITAFGTVFWLMAELIRPERMYTFSSHAMPYQALVEIGFWQKDIVTDDSRIFLQGFFRFNGNFRVVPIYIPVSMDSVMADTLRQSARNLYKQQRRWAWGVEHFPYIMEQFRQHKEIKFGVKFKYVFNLMEGMFSWATAPILIFILGRLPLWVAGHGSQSTSVIVQNTPYVLEWLMTLAMLGMFVSAIFSFLVLPQRPKHAARHRWLIMILQWVLLPFTLVIFGSIPAIDAQTRLMLGKKYHLGFWVTPKPR